MPVKRVTFVIDTDSTVLDVIASGRRWILTPTRRWRRAERARPRT